MRNQTPAIGDLEDRLQKALREKIDSAPVPSPARRFTPSTPHMSRRRRPVAVGAAAAVLVALVSTILVVVSPSDEPDRSLAVGVPTVPLTPNSTAAPALPRIAIDLPGLHLAFVDETIIPPGQPAAGGPGVDGFYVQSFRTPAGLVPPMLWVLSVPPPPSERNDYGFALGRPVSVQGGTGRVQGTGPSLRLTWPGPDGGGVIMASWGLSEEALVAVANGLRPRAQGWDATVLTAGLAPVVDSSRAAGKLDEGGRRVEQAYRGTSRSSLNLTVSDAAPVSFEDRVMGIGSAKSVQSVTVAGRQGLVIEAGGDGSRWSVVWQPTETTMAELRLSQTTREGLVTSDDVLAVIVGVHLVTEDQWQDRLPDSTVPSARLGAEAERLQAGAPLPAGTPRGAFASPPAARDRINLANDIYRYSLCAWVRDWFTADAAGDAARAEAAVVALEGAKAWPVVPETVSSGDVPVDRGTPLAMRVRAGDLAFLQDYVGTTCR